MNFTDFAAHLKRLVGIFDASMQPLATAASTLKRTIRITTIVLATLSVNTVYAETVFQSGAEQVSLLELYTSEGCSSCPPADLWFGKLADHASLWEQLVPVAFHVDYWDSLGWKDRFSRPEFSNRQEWYAQTGAIPFAYTPGFVLNGMEWRNLRGVPPTIVGGNVGALTVTINAGKVTIAFIPSRPVIGDTLVANITLLGFGLTSEIRAGENSGRRLAHDFVVLTLKRKALHGEHGKYFATTSIPRSNVSAKRYAMSLWVTADGDQTPIQAVGGWLVSNH